MIIGNVGKDPEIRIVQDGSKFASFSVATTESRRDKVSGERIDKTEWHRVVVFNEHFTEVVEKYAKKGSKLYVEGQLQTKKWTDAQGVDRYVTEVVVGKYRGEVALLDSRQQPDDIVSQTTDSGGGYVASATATAGDDAERMMKDDLPF
jgi:single-strand DNA-binding protein